MDIFRDYYESKLALDILTKEVEEKKEEIVKFLLSLPDNRNEIPGAKFYLKKDFIYEFSKKANQKIAQIEFDLEKQKEIIKMEQVSIKRIKAQEIEDGTAKLLDTKYVPVMTIKK